MVGAAGLQDSAGQPWRSGFASGTAWADRLDIDSAGTSSVARST